MSANATESKLKAALERLEQSTRKLIGTRGYSKDVKSLKALEEMIREQLIHENTRSSTRTIR
jgi:hypothetical protein